MITLQGHVVRLELGGGVPEAPVIMMIQAEAKFAPDLIRVAVTKDTAKEFFIGAPILLRILIDSNP